MTKRSKLANQLLCDGARDTGYVRANMNALKYLSFDIKDQNYEHDDTKMQLSLSTVFSIYMYYPRHKPEERHRLQRQMVRAVIEDIFGEFRMPLIEAQVHIEAMEYDEALAKIKEIHEIMFEGV